MKRMILPLLSVASLLLAGSVMAQSDYGGSNQPADTTAATAPAGSAAEQGSMAGSTSDPQSTTGTQTHSSLPRTASDVPVVFAFGVIGAGALLALRAYRVRNAG